MNTTTRYILQDARTLVHCGWTQRASARDFNERPVDCRSNKTMFLCLVGALKRAVPPDVSFGFFWTAYYLLCSLAEAKDNSPIFYENGEFNLSRWNDFEGRTQQDVLDLLDEAIALYDYTR